MESEGVEAVLAVDERPWLASQKLASQLLAFVTGCVAVAAVGDGLRRGGPRWSCGFGEGE